MLNFCSSCRPLPLSPPMEAVQACATLLGFKWHWGPSLGICVEWSSILPTECTASPKVFNHSHRTLIWWERSEDLKPYNHNLRETLKTWVCFTQKYTTLWRSRNFHHPDKGIEGASFSVSKLWSLVATGARSRAVFLYLLPLPCAHPCWAAVPRQQAGCLHTSPLLGLELPWLAETREQVTSSSPGKEMQIMIQDVLRQKSLKKLKNHLPSLVPLGDLKIFPKRERI